MRPSDENKQQQERTGRRSIASQRSPARVTDEIKTVDQYNFKASAPLFIERENKFGLRYLVFVCNSVFPAARTESD